MKDYVKRMEVELEELEEKMSKLASFVYSGKKFRDLGEEKQDLLRTQLSIMDEYARVLLRRIELEK